MVCCRFFHEVAVIPAVNQLALNARSNSNTLAGPNTNNTWEFSSTGDTLDQIATFTGMQRLVGGTRNDTFVFNGAGFSGSIDGGTSGTDIMDFSKYGSPVTVHVTGNGTYHGMRGTATGLGGGFNDIDAFTSATSLSSSVNPSMYNQDVTFTAVVSSRVVGTPGGSVTFSDANGNVLGTVPLSVVNGVDEATFTTSTLAVGNNTITATYSGDSKFAGSNATLMQQVNAVTSASLQTMLNTTPQPTFQENDYSDVQTLLNAINNLGPQSVPMTISIDLASGNVGDGNNIIMEGNGNDDIDAGNGDNLIVAGLGRHDVHVGNGSNILIDGSVQLLNGATLSQILTEWISQGKSAASSIRSDLSVTYNTHYANTLHAGSGLDWFWATDTRDHLNVKKTDLLN